MIIKQLDKRDYNRLHHSLMQTAQAAPLEASYTAKLTVNAVEYALKIQPESDCQMAILQAVRISRTADGPNFELITQNHILTALIDLLIEQGLD